MVSEYHLIKARLLNSQELLEGTNLALFNINEATLVSVMSTLNIHLGSQVKTSYSITCRCTGTRIKQGGMK